MQLGGWTGLYKEEIRKEDKQEATDAAIAEEDQWQRRFKQKNQADVIRTLLAKRMGQGGTLTMSAEKKALLSKLQGMLPEDSELSHKFVYASEENLKQMDAALTKAKTFAETNRRLFTPEDAEDIFENFTVEVIDKGKDFDPTDMLETLGFTEDMVTAMKGEFGDIFKTESAVSFTPKTNVDGTNIGDQKALTDLYRETLGGVVANSIQEMTSAQSNGQTIDQQKFNLLKEAESALKASTPSTAKAVRAVGADVAIQIMELNPTFRDVADYINKGLVFQQSDEGMALLKRAVKSGLIDVGDSYEVSGLGTKKMTDSLKDELMG